MKQRIYLDNNASTPLDPRILDVVAQDLRISIANPSSTHSFGQESRKRLVEARQTIASYLEVKPSEIVFTSGATEAANLVIRGLFEKEFKGHIITSSVEHACVYSTVKALEPLGISSSFLQPGLWGAVTPETVKAALRSDTRLIALMAVNNETGVKTDIAAIAEIAQKAKVPLLVDGVALLGKEPFTIPPGVSAMIFSGHKFHAPKGIGFAYLSSQLQIKPQLTGGVQENNKRGGTENISGIVGMAEAVRLLKKELPAASERMASLRDRLEKGILSQLPFVMVNGAGPRIGNTSNLAFGNLDGEALLMRLDLEGIAVSHGSACHSGALEPSRILLNMGLPMALARSSLRFSLSRFTTEEEIDACIEAVTKVMDNG